MRIAMNHLEKETDEKGHYRYSLENKIPNTELCAREVLTQVSDIQVMTSVGKKRQGRILCAVCWSSIVESHR